MQESESLRIFVSKEGRIRNHLKDVCMGNIPQKAERGKKTGSESTTRFRQVSCFKRSRVLCQKHGGTRTAYYLGVPKV
jgi:hypothetical protein